ncbi:MAG TPA: thioredoxin fold domain-containing protein [Rubricoccaceae bacterium]|jgi:thioredoxin-related protein
MLRLPLAAALAALFALPAAAQVTTTAETDASVVPADAPTWLSMEEAVAKARADSTTLLVHTYATWCGWCARFDREVYTDDSVQAYLKDRFTLTRVDLEGQQVVPFFEHSVPMATLGQAFGVTGTPTTVFVGPDGQLLTKLPGYTDVATFLQVLRYVHEDEYENGSFRDYVNRLNGTGMPALQQAAPDVAPGG